MLHSDEVAYILASEFKLGEGNGPFGGMSGQETNAEDVMMTEGLASQRKDGEDDMLSSDVISQEDFPRSIFMPPTPSLLATHECQLCFRSKRVQQPSDWTEHIHEDIKPLACTWYGCQDGVMFDSTADWIRHEKGHRHGEWWSCDIEGCTSSYHNREYILRHLVNLHIPQPRHRARRSGTDLG
ncbi:hypothetical protein CDD83_9373 [Cordyceps sp. RAO-2017]|nr:hypothetical protein CDD83_9373 [Cordyceps sp. RAO-2017]